MVLNILKGKKMSLLEWVKKNRPDDLKVKDYTNTKKTKKVSRIRKSEKNVRMD